MAEAIIMEIRAGAGGEEAAIFAGDLFKMYSKYAFNQKWQCLVIDSNESDLGGLKQITFEIKGDGAFDKLKNEGGVHRVQRVPQTEKSNRLHTSTASVAVLPKANFAEVNLNLSDIRQDFYKSSAKGGQNVNKRQTAIRLTHLPSGLVVTCQTERNLDKNRETALAVLRSKLLAMEKNKVEGAITEERRAQIGQADRSEKIRTYNFPQDRLTDHRINKSFHQIEKIMDGKLDKVISTLQGQLA